MVKGSTKQVVVVKAPHPALFDQAIFILKEEALQNPGITPDLILAQARKAANHYAKTEDIFASTAGVLGIVWGLMGVGLASFFWGLGLYFYL